MESHDWWAPIKFSVKEMSTRVKHVLSFLLEDNTHRFIKCPIACIIWKYLSNIWQVLTRCRGIPRVRVGSGVGPPGSWTRESGEGKTELRR